MNKLVIPNESSSHENKVTFNEKSKYNFLNTVCAFANKNSGTIFVGIDDNLQVVGIDNPKEIINKITTAINSKIVPIPIFDIHKETFDGKSIIVVRILKGKKKPYFVITQNGLIAYTRRGDQSHKVNKDEILSLILEGEHLSYDELPSKYSYQEASFNTLNARFRSLGKKTIENYNDLVSLRLAEDGILTNAGALLADNGFILSSQIFATRWNGLEKANSDKDALDKQDIKGGLLDLLQGAERFIQNNSRIMFKKVDSERIEYPEYPQRAIQEALVNAIIHRDYSINNSQINIHIYDDRLEISSPGSMIDNTLIQERDIYVIESVRRNPIIADIFTQLNLMERRGSGLKKILNSYTEQENYRREYEPQFYSDERWFRVILKNLNFPLALLKKNLPYNNAFSNKNENEWTTNHTKNGKTDEQINLVLSFANKKQEFKRVDIDKLLNVSPSRSRQILDKLVAENKIIKISDLKATKYKLNS